MACHMDGENEVSGIKLLNANMRLTALHHLLFGYLILEYVYDMRVA